MQSLWLPHKKGCLDSERLSKTPCRNFSDSESQCTSLGQAQHWLGAEKDSLTVSDSQHPPRSMCWNLITIGSSVMRWVLWKRSHEGSTLINRIHNFKIVVQVNFFPFYHVREQLKKPSMRNGHLHWVNSHIDFGLASFWTCKQYFCVCG